MKIFTYILFCVASILLPSNSGQESDSNARRETATKEISLSIHFLDGLSASPNDRLPDIRFLHYGCHLSLLLTNKSDQMETLWKPYCPEGDAPIRLEFKKTADSETIGTARTSHGYTGGMGIPKTFTLKPDDSLVYRIDFSSFWSLPFVLNDGDDTTVFIRAVYNSRKADGSRNLLPDNSDDVWVGEIATEWQQVRLSNVSGKRIETRNEGNILK